MKNLLTSNFSKFLFKNSWSVLSRNFAIKARTDYFTSTNERLENKAKNTGSSADQTQNYEKNIFIRKRNDIEYNDESNFNVKKDLDNMFDNIESTNSKYMKNVSNDSLKRNEMPYNEFLNKSDEMFSFLKNAFEEIATEDSNISLDFDKRNLYVRINIQKVGSYVISKELETRLIAVTSPLSGLFKYTYDPVSKYWISVKDSHIMDELLSREFCEHSKGLLIINH